MTSGDRSAKTVAEVVSSIARTLMHRLPDDGADAGAGLSIADDATSLRRAEHEARELVAAVMHQPRFWPSIAAATVLDQVQRTAIDLAAARRAKGAPLAYAVRSAQFRALTLYVDERVLIPRPETEYLVERVLALRGAHVGGIAVDVGTGSGAIALSLAAEGGFSRVIATDVSHDALAVARENASRSAESLRCPVEFRAGDALAPLGDMEQALDLLVSNPPYIAFEELPSLPAGVRNWEPALALACADEGMAVTRTIVAESGSLLRPGGILAFETDSRRAQRVAQLVRDAGLYDAVEVLLDLTGRERYVVARRRTTN